MEVTMNQVMSALPKNWSSTVIKARYGATYAGASAANNFSNVSALCAKNPVVCLAGVTVAGVAVVGTTAFASGAVAEKLVPKWTQDPVVIEKLSQALVEADILRQQTVLEAGQGKIVRKAFESTKSAGAPACLSPEEAALGVERGEI